VIRQRLFDWARPRRNPLREILTLDKLHHQRADSVRLFETVNVGITWGRHYTNGRAIRDVHAAD